MLEMLTFGLIVLALIVGSRIIQERSKFTTPISLIGFVVAMAAFDIGVIDMTGDLFDKFLLMALPILLIVDVLILKPRELKENWFSIFLMAGVSVGLAVLAGVLLKEFILPEYNIPIAAMVALMTMVVATDPVAVAAVFGGSKLPHDLKFMAEAESLHNDPTAFVIFTIAVAVMGNPEMTGAEIATQGGMTVFGAVGIGLVAGFVGIGLLRLSHDAATEAFIIIMVAMLAFWGAELFHFAGIAAVVVAGVLMNTLITSRGEKLESEVEEMKKQRRFGDKFEYLVHTLDNHKEIVSYVAFVAAIANTILFISIADLINFELLLKYWVEILAVFAATTLIRAVTMGGVAIISNSMPSMRDINVDWWAVLTFAGVKGGLSILMLHMMPKDFEYLPMFEAIVVGNIILSIFVYSAVLIALIHVRGEALEEEKPKHTPMGPPGSVHMD